MPNFPIEFKEKEKVALICPNCNGCMNGIWRFYNHTFIHDPIQRFRCPTCNKRFAKVSEIGQPIIFILCLHYLYFYQLRILNQYNLLSM